MNRNYEMIFALIYEYYKIPNYALVDELCCINLFFNQNFKEGEEKMGKHEQLT